MVRPWSTWSARNTTPKPPEPISTPSSIPSIPRSTPSCTATPAAPWRQRSVWTVGCWAVPVVVRPSRPVTQRRRRVTVFRCDPRVAPASAEVLVQEVDGARPGFLGIRLVEVPERIFLVAERVAHPGVEDERDVLVQLLELAAERHAGVGRE